MSGICCKCRFEGCPDVGRMFSSQGFDEADATVADLLLNPEIFNGKMSYVPTSALARCSNSGASIAVDAGRNIKTEISSKSLHAKACCNSFRDTMEFVFRRCLGRKSRVLPTSASHNVHGT